MTLEQAIAVADEFFSFDYLGDAWLDLRQDLDDESLQDALAETLTDVMCEEKGEDDREIFAEAAKARVLQFVKSSKSAAGTGCGK